MIALISANLINLAGNWLLVFGNLGAPRLGAEGSGWATCISRVYMMLFLGAVIWRSNRDLVRARRTPDFCRIRDLLALGLPAAVQIGLETGVFAVVTVLIGKLGATRRSALRRRAIRRSWATWRRFTTRARRP
jgi:MATE family multidrug resistance protein